MDVPILMYHHVAREPLPGFRKYTVTPDALQRQMRLLVYMRYTPITLDTLIEARQGTRPFPRRPVVITFDDGFQECIEHAAPVLKKYAMPATFYLVAGFMGQTSDWLARERGIALPLADWRTARQLLADGFQCGAHSLTHPRLTELGEKECRRELMVSRQCLEQNLGQGIVHLAYPFGAWNTRVRQVAGECGYRSACSVEIGLSTPGDSLFALRRVPITGFDTSADFVCRLRTGWSCRDWLRGRLDISSARRAGGATAA